MQLVHTSATESGGQQIDIVLVIYVLTGLKIHFPIALQVTDFSESIITTTGKYSHFTVYKTDLAACKPNSYY